MNLKKKKKKGSSTLTTKSSGEIQLSPRATPVHVHFIKLSSLKLFFNYLDELIPPNLRFNVFALTALTIDKPTVTANLPP